MGYLIAVILGASGFWSLTDKSQAGDVPSQWIVGILIALFVIEVARSSRK